MAGQIYTDPGCGRVGFVYFIQCGRGGPIKIGYAADPVARCAAHQVSSPHSLTLLGAYPGSMADERALHRRFAADRVRGEWFRGTAALRKEIKRARISWRDHTIARNNAETAGLLADLRDRRMAEAQL